MSLQFFLCLFTCIGYCICTVFIGKFLSLITLWNYTTLKQIKERGNSLSCLITLWNYTTLKPAIVFLPFVLCLITLWNYTTLKLSSARPTVL